MTNIPRLNRGNILFIFIDLQDRLLKMIADSETIIARVELLLSAANALGLPYITTTQYRKGLGDLSSSLAPRVSGSIMDKTTFSCSGDPMISARLRESNRNSVILCGVETHICVLQTCLDLLAKDFQVAVVANGVSARSRLDHELGLKRMEKAGALAVTAEMVIYELLERSDSEDFKKILPLIKQRN